MQYLTVGLHEETARYKSGVGFGSTNSPLSTAKVMEKG